MSVDDLAPPPWGRAPIRRQLEVGPVRARGDRQDSDRAAQPGDQPRDHDLFERIGGAAERGSDEGHPVRQQEQPAAHPDDVATAGDRPTGVVLAGDDRIGRLVEVGPTRAIFTNPTDDRTEAYITGRFG